tara:strand:+ start:724 stop:1815 length:1092 start_codon:yes stop_codon:yes gene_type:complete
MEVKKYIVFGVLNWGLGHATRSIPLIQKLLDLGYSPVIASDGAALLYLKKEFPQCSFEELASYGINYKFENLFLQTLYSGPKILKAIRKEKKQLKQIIEKYKPLALVSDNRLGFHSTKLPCAYISHQNTIIAPFPLSLVNILHYYFINKYQEFWIPDFQGSPNLAGKLSQRKRRAEKIKYLGPLSRFSHKNSNQQEKDIDLLIILSGPEPQRSKLESKLLSQISELDIRSRLIRGSENLATIEDYDGLEIRDLVLGDELLELIERSELILSRSGYSSIMDYYFLGTKAIIIPTPGQSEQEYLAKKLSEEAVFYSSNQEDLDLKEALLQSKKYLGFRKKDGYPKLNNLEDILLSFLQGKTEGRS